MFNPFLQSHRIATEDGSRLDVETAPEAWGGNIGLQTVDGGGEATVVQLNLDEAREVAAALSVGIKALSKLID